ncbi:MAG: ribonuclease J [Alphaproteobacteria bacterium]
MKKKYNKDDLLFVPLGGAGEIGMNMYLYGLNGKWIMVDCGVTFGDEKMEAQGLEVIMPNPSFIEDNIDDLLGIVITHAHEDHIGAIPYLWNRFRCPIFGTKFAAHIARRKLKEVRLLKHAEIVEIAQDETLEIGDFEIDFVPMAHSIPDANALAIRTKQGNILHTGDWKFDPRPLVGNLTDEAYLKDFAEEGILAMISDSTGATTPGHSGSEGEVRDNIIALVKKLKKGAVFVSCFSSNLARIETAILAAEASGRQVYIAGRSVYNMLDAGRKTGLLGDLPQFVKDKHVQDIPRDKLLVICTGSQGESRSALPRICGGDHKYIDLKKGDKVLFSSRTIPGNELKIEGLQQRILAQGGEIYTQSSNPIHVSGHPSQDELKRMYSMVHAKTLIPMHGEARHNAANVAIAKEAGIPNALIIQDGDVVKLNQDVPSVIDHVKTGLLVWDGMDAVPLTS